MNIYNIKEQSTVLEEIGYTIDTSQRMKLQLGLLKLCELANADNLVFWGKIFTTGQSYYISMSIDFKGHYSFPQKKFYYSNQNFIFQQFPELDIYNKEQIDKFNHLPFTGNPNHILINIQPDGESKQEQIKADESDDESVIKITPKNLTQVDRLNYVVRATQIQCNLCPVGSFRINEKHQIRYNESFKGLAIQNLDLTNFQHFRYPQQQNSIKVLQSAQSIFKNDIFDRIQNSLFWSLQLNTKQTIATVRSLLWPGYTSYSFVEKSKFGGIYYGNGCKNVDLCFYL